MSDSNNTELLLRENKDRFVILPINYPQSMGNCIKNMKPVFGRRKEIDLSSDQKDWDSLNEGERHFISHIMHFLQPVMVS
jgi:ribonucleoside-diphosphate reductase beta chain